MFNSKKIACVIPARLKSTRFPKKMLAKLKNKPLIQWVWERARTVSVFDDVVLAIDAEETASVVKSFGGKFYMTSESCPSGTDRLIELIQTKKIDADIFVNWQGDEPFIDAQMIGDLLQSCGKEQSDIWTLKKRILKMEEVNSPQFAKVVCDKDGYALYFSRSPIPYYRDETDDAKKTFFKHIGLYAYTREALNKIATLKPCPLETAEQLEQLRFLYHNLRVRVHETQAEVIGIDLPEHIDKAEARMDRHPFV